MKNNRKKVILITMIMMMFGMVYQTAWKGNIAQATTSANSQIAGNSQGIEISNQDEFSELLSGYESEAPKIESAELSSAITSEKGIEVYLKTNRNDIKKVVISGWSGGVYKDYLTSKTAQYDEMRNIYTVTFSFDEIVNTETNKVESKEVAEYYFDACVYANNGSMSYANLDKVQYTETGIITTTTTNSETNKTEIAVTAEEDGYVAVLNANEEVTESTTWQKVTAGETTKVAVPANNTTNSTTNSTNTEATTVSEALSQENTKQVKVLYKAGEEVTEEDLNNGTVTENSIMLLSTDDESVTEESDTTSSENENMSNFQDSDLFTFEYSQNSGKNDWISYDDTPNVLESTIQGLANTTATATIKIKTEYPVIVNFEYMVSSEEEFDTFEINGDEENILSGENDWQKFSGQYEPDENGIVTITLTYSKDKNINRHDDKAAIRNLVVTSIMPRNGEVVINDGATITNNATLNLSISVDGASEMLITENTNVPSLTDSRWEAFAETKAYTLQNTEDGLKTVYVWFKNEIDALSETAAQASIKVDTIAPTNTAPEIEKETSTTVTVNLKQTDANELMSVKYGYRINGSTDEYTWTDNIRINNTIDTTVYTISGLTEMTEYEIVTKVSDEASDEVTSESTIVKTKIPSDNISITKSPASKTLGNVTVTINWNDTTYTHEYSLDNRETWTTETNATTTIELTENQTIYYRMKNDTYDTGDLEYVVDNIDREGPKVEKIEVVSPETGTYGIDDVITIELTWNEEVTVVELPKLNINFGDGIAIPLTATENTATTITYKYTITEADGGYLGLYSLEGGLLKDSLNNENLSVLPELTGSTIFVENAAYIASKNKYYGTIQNAVNAAKTEATTIKVVANTELRDTLIIQEGQNITIDLNGKTISITNEEAIVTAIENAETLTIIDSSAEQTGKIIATSQNKSAYTIINNPTGTLTVKAGKVEAISNSSFVSINSYAIYNKGAGTVTLGVNDDTVSTEKPELIATAKTGYGLYVATAEGNINFYDGIIKGTEKAISLVKGFTNYNVKTAYTEVTETRTENNTVYEVLYLSDEAKVELTMNGKTVGYKSILEAVAQIPRDGRLGSVKVLTDETLTEIIKIYQGQNVEIDLNGYTLTRTEDIDGAVYALINNGTLRILDSSANQTGRIEAIAQKDVTTYAVYNYTNGNLTIDGGTLFAKIDVEDKKEYAYGLYINSVEKISFKSGEIYNEQNFIDSTKTTAIVDYYMNQRYETINNVEYKVNYISSSPIVTLTINSITTGYNGINQAVNEAATDGTISIIKMEQDEYLVNYINIEGNKNIQLDLNGKSITAENLSYGIYNNSSGNLEIKGGSITASSTKSLYGIYNKISGSVIINDSTIMVSSSDISYGIYNYGNGSISMNEGMIFATSSYSAGNYNKVYGLYNNSNGSIDINGGTIIADSNFYYHVYSYGVYINNINAKVYMSGGEIKGKAYAFYMIGDMGINNSGEIEYGKINLPKNKYIGYKIEEEYVVNYVENGEYTVELTIGETVTNYLSIQDAINTIPSNGTLGKIKLIQSENLKRVISIAEGQNVEIDLNGKIIYNQGQTTILNKGMLKVEDRSEEGTGSIISSSSRYIYGINNSGNLEIYGGTIEVNRTGYYTADSYVISNSGNIVINGGLIKGYANDYIYGIYNNSGRIIINDGKIMVGGGSASIYGMYNDNNGSIIINGGLIDAKAGRFTYGIFNKSNGVIEINGGTNSSYQYGIFNNGLGSIIINGGVISNDNNDTYGIYNNNNGNIEIYGGVISAISYGIYNNLKGNITIGNNDGIINNKDIQIISGSIGLYLKTLGGSVNIYDGIIKGYNNAIMPLNTIYENRDEISESEYLINIPKYTQMCDSTELELKIKYLEYIDSYVPSGDEIIDQESPYVLNIEVISSEIGGYAKGDILKLKSNWNEQINTTLEDAPELKIKFGMGVEKLATVKEIGNNYIVYEYTIEQEDEGYLNFVSYLNGSVVDNSNNNWQVTNINLVGTEIVAGTKVYAPAKGKYYYNLQEAINDTELEASEYTTLQLVKNEECYGYGITIKETQKIEIDLNGNTIDIQFVQKGITNSGDLKIEDTSIEQKGSIKYLLNSYFNYACGIYNNKGANIVINSGNINVCSKNTTSIYNTYAIYNYDSGNIEINGGEINVFTSYDAAYGIYNNSSGSLLINNGVITVGKNDSSYNNLTCYGVYNNSDGSIEINGGYISSGVNLKALSSYGIYIRDITAKIYLTGGEWKAKLYAIKIPEDMEINNSGTIDIGKINLPENKGIGYRVEDENVINYITDKKFIVELTVEETITKHLSVQEAIDNIPTNGTLGKIKLIENINILKPIEIKEEQSIELDLNGKSIYSQATNAITNNGRLNLEDNSDEQKGVITSYRGIYNNNDGNIEINGGTINYLHSGIYNDSTKNIKINSGKFINTEGYGGYGIYNNNSCNVEINGGVILANARDSNSNAFGIYNYSTGNVTITGGLISISNDVSDVYGIYNRIDGNVEITGGTIEVETNIYHDAYGIYNYTGNIKISGGTIRSTSYGIYLNKNETTVILNDGEWKGIKKGIHIPEGMPVNNSGHQENGMINIPVNKHIGYRIENEYIVNYLDDGAYIIELTVGEKITTYSKLQDAINNIPTDETLGKIKLIGSEFLINTVEIKTGQKVEIDLNGKELYSTLSITIKNNGYLTIEDNSIEKKGIINSNTKETNAHGIYNEGKGKVIINGGTISTNFYYTGGYSYDTYGIYNDTNETIVINEGEIISSGRLYSYGIYNNINGTIEINGGSIITKASSDKGIYNNGNGRIEINAGLISSLSNTIYNKLDGTIEINGGILDSNMYGIYNYGSGNVKMNGGKIELFSTTVAYGIYNNVGSIDINGGEISAYTTGNSSGSNAYGINFVNNNSYFSFKGGKILGKTESIYPTTKNIELEFNTYVKKYSENVDGIVYQVAEVGEVSNVKLLNNGNLAYYDSLSKAMAAVPTDNSLTQIQMLTDDEMFSDITIASGKNIQLDLNGKKITYKSNTKIIKAFINNGTFEIIDSGENGKIEIEASGYDAYAVYNGNSSSYKTATFKLIDGTINVTSNGNNSYGIYNYCGTNISEGNEAIRIEGGNINVISKADENGVISGLAYGISNDKNSGSGGIVIIGENTSVIATSELNDSYGVYNSYTSSNILTIGEKDNTVSMTSPYIEGGTNGIYKSNSGTFNFYDGAITGLSTKSVNGTISNIEDDSKVYVIDNQDGTETTILYREVRTMEVTPEAAYFGTMKENQNVEIVYTLPDASDATITYEVEDDTIAGVRLENNQYVIYPKAIGRTMVTFTVTDIAGVSMSDTIEILIDNVPPNNMAPSATTTSTSVTITCNQTDDDGIDQNSIKYAYSSDNGVTWSDWTNRSTISGLTSDTEYLVKTKAGDFAGNETESQTTSIRTKLPNNSTFVLEPNTATKENVKVTITWNNPESTPQYYKIGADGEWILTTDEITEITVTDNTEVYTKLVYSSGETTEDSEIKSILVDNIDRLTPTGTIEINEEEPRYDGRVTLKITTADDAVTVGDNAGAVVYMYLTEETLTDSSEIQEDAWIRYEGDNLDYEYFLKNEGTTKVNIWLKDKAGNVSQVITSEEITNEPPMVVLVEDDIIIGEYDTINLAYTAARTSNTNASKIIVCKNTSITSQLTIASTKNIILDLNGKTVTMTIQTPIYNQGTLEVTDTLGNGVLENTYNSTSAYGLYNPSGTLKVTAGTIKCDKGYGIYNYSSSSKVIIGNNDGSVSITTPVIIGATYGIYRSSGTFEFYDGVIQGKEKQSISCPWSYLTVAENYGIKKVVENAIETATLVYDTTAPTIEKLTITNDTDVNTQTITAVNSADIGSGICAYILSQTSTVPTKTSSNWITITQTNGPEDFEYKAIANGTWYLWLMDGAGNISETKSITAENVKIKVTSVTMNAISLNVAEQKQAIITLNPTTGEPKNKVFSIANDEIAYVNPDTGMLTGISLGTTTLTCTILNYNDSVITKTCNVTVADKAPSIISEPQDRTVVEGTETQFVVDADGTNLNYQWYQVKDGVETELNDEDVQMFKSNIEGQANTTATQTITINTTTEGTLSFDYMVTSEETNDTFTVTVTDANGTTTAVNSISGEVGWTNYSADFTPTAEGKVVVTLTYSKNSSVDGGLDFGAIRNLSYYYYGIINAESTFENIEPFTFIPQNVTVSGVTKEAWVADVEEGVAIYRSNNQSGHNTSANSSVQIKIPAAGTLSFDYRVSSESGFDKLTIKVIDGTTTTTVANAISGAGSWKSHSQQVTPDVDGNVTITLLYSKDGSADKNGDIGAIRNLKINAEGYTTDFCSFENSSLYTLEGSQFESIKLTGTNTETLTLPSEFVNNANSGNKYYCVVSNAAGTATSRQALLTIADEEIPVTEQITKTAPTLEVGNKQITVTSNQTGPNITNTYYAISEERVTYSEWQESNVFSNLTEGKTYYVKTKVTASTIDSTTGTTVTTEQESASSFAVILIYVASLAENSEVTYYKNVQDAVTAASTSNPTEQSIVTMLKDEIRTTYVNVTSGKNILLDLNGKELTIANSNSGNLNGIYNNQAKLEVNDTTGNGKIITSLSANTSSYNAYGIYNYRGTVVVDNVEIKVVRPNAYKSYAYGVFADRATTTIGNNNNDMSIEKPKITSTGYGLYKTGSGTFNFYDGIVTAEADKAIYAASGNFVIPEFHKIKIEKNGISQETAYLEARDITKVFITEWTTPSSSTQIKLPVPSNANNQYEVEWGDGNIEVFDSTTNFPTHTYTTAGKYQVIVSGTIDSFGYYGETAPTSSDSATKDYYTFTKYVTGIKSWGRVGFTRVGFANCTKLIGVIPNPSEKSFENVTSMENLFYKCTGLTGAIPAELFVNAQKVTSFRNTFYGCSNFSGMIPAKLFYFKSDVTTYEGMFEGCKSLTAGEIAIDIKRAVNMDRMFKDCEALESVVFGRNSRHLNGTAMFEGASSLRAVILLNQATAQDQVGVAKDLATLGLRDEAIIYVPYKANEEVYEQAWTTIPTDKIEMIVKANEPNPDYVERDGTYIDETGYTVAGFGMNETDKYTQYGFRVEIDGIPVDTSEVGSEWITYTLYKGKAE